MGTVTCDDKAFIVDGHRVWIVSGAVHYFRVPRELWRDRLVKLKRAGCNTVETYVAWNAHEPREGRFDFSGGLDLDAFLTLAEELGLWIIVRPGPYICSEWDNGGIPAWLNVKPGIKLRVANSVYHAAIRAFFEKLIPIVAKHQATRGGRVILVQDENEYVFRNRPGGREHLVFLRDLLRKLGIDVPIIVCDFLYERIDDTVECWNGWDNIEKSIETLRKAQPEAPNLITEFWVGWFSAWGHPEITAQKSPRAVHEASMKILAAGGMYNYYMFHGGTSFGHYPGRTVGADDVYNVSSYDSDAPLSETGCLTEKYYKAKLASVLGSNLSAFFADSEPASLAVTSRDEVEIVTRSAPQGNVIFVFNRSKRKRAAHITIPGGAELEVSFADVDAVALPYRFSPVPGFTIDYSNLSLLGMTPMGVGRLVFLYGPRGKSAVLGAQGRTFRRIIGADTQMWFGNFPNLVAVMDTRRAERTWFLGDRTIVGGDYCGEARSEKTTVGCRGEETLIAYFPNGRVSFASYSRIPQPAKLPELRGWKKKSLLPTGKPAGSKRVDDGRGNPVALEKTGYFGGYGWYYAKLNAARSGQESLLVSDAEDRLTVFANGRRVTTFGRGQGASMGLVPLPLKKGANDLHILLDNLGRANYGLSLGETKGLRGPMYLGARVADLGLTWTPGRYNGKLADTWQMESMWPEVQDVAATLSVIFETAKGEGAVLRLQNVAEPAGIFLNHEFHSYYWGDSVCRRLDLAIPASSLKAGRNLLELCFFIRPDGDISRRISLYAFDESRVLDTAFYFLPLEAPKWKAARGARAAAGTPVVWETTFKFSHPSAPVFFVPAGLRKGEIWLNGRMVSRYWDIGPQKRSYLPEPWLKGANTLLVVDEFGASPAKAYLEYDEAGIMNYETV
jgi:beta-galactosidase